MTTDASALADTTARADTTAGAARAERADAAAPADSGAAAQAVATASDTGARVVAVIIAFAWHLAIGLPAVLRNWPELALPPVVGAAWLVTAAAGLVAARRLLTGAEPPVRPLVAVLLVVDATVFVATGSEHLFHAANWVWGTLGWFFVLVAWARPTRVLGGLLTAHALIALVAVLGHEATQPADLSRYTMYVYGTSALPIAVFVGRGILAAQARARATTTAALLAVEAEQAAAVRASRERIDRLELVSATARLILTELADGRADPADPDVQQRSALAAARLRRLIAESDDVPDPLLHELRASADLAERHGVPVDLVTVGTPPPLPVEIRRRLADPLAATLATARGWARLTVVAGPDEVVVSVVTPAPPADLRAAGRALGSAAARDPAAPADDDGLVDYLYERDEELTWAQTRWRAG